MSGGSGPSDSTSDPPSGDIDRIVKFIESDLDFTTSFYNASYLRRRIDARMYRTEADDPGDYFQLLRSDPAEQDLLIDALSINVTSFFRNPEVWTQLRGILQKLSQETSNIVMWSAPCSDGREPYSLAMLALEDADIDEANLKILGTDISDDAISAARQGSYCSTSTTDIAKELSFLESHEEYVEKTGDEFTVKPNVRELVSFKSHDLINDPPPDTFDLILCRNLLIYIHAEYKEAIFETLDSAIVEGGYLVLGMSELLPRRFRARYDKMDGSSVVLQKK